MDIQSIKESPAIQRLLEHYGSLEHRERRLIKILVVFMLLIIVIIGLVLPATKYNNNALGKYKESMETLRWMQEKQSLFTGSASQAKRDPSQSLLGIANSSSKKFNISFQRYQPVGEDALSLTLDDTVFNNVVVWLALLDKRYGIQVKEIAVDRQDEKGLVNVRLVLQG